MTKHNKAQDGALETSEGFLAKNGKALVIGVIAVLVIIGGYFAYQGLIAKPNEEKAHKAIAAGENYFKNGLYDIVINGDSIYFDGLVKVAEQYKGTKAGNLSNYYIGVSYQKLGQYENAIQYLEKFSVKDEMVYPASLIALGNCYANTDQLAKAVSTLKKAASIANNNSLSPIALRQAGIILEKEGKYKEALELYTEIKVDYFRSAIAGDIDKYIERAKAQI